MRSLSGRGSGHREQHTRSGRRLGMRWGSGGLSLDLAVVIRAPPSVNIGPLHKIDESPD